MKYQYKVEVNTTIQVLEQFLNDMSKEGWEVVEILMDNHYVPLFRLVIVLRKPLQEIL